MTAQILTHARFSTLPVTQHPRRGRFPKGVPSLMIFARDKFFKSLERDRLERDINEMCNNLVGVDRYRAELCYRLAQAEQQRCAEKAMTVQQSNVGRV